MAIIALSIALGVVLSKAWTLYAAETDGDFENEEDEKNEKA